MTWSIGGKEVRSRLILGSARYPSIDIFRRSVEDSKTEIVTVSLRRLALDQKSQDSRFIEILKNLNVHLLPNTAGCRSSREAVTTARLAREVFNTNWIKLETVGDDYNLQPDPFATLEAAEILLREGFEVFPYITDDLVVAERLLGLGCRILMPWGSPIGSALGLLNPLALKTLRSRFPNVTLIVDAGLGAPSHAAQAMELGFDGVLLNSAVALSREPQIMAKAFAAAVEAGHLGFKAGIVPSREFATPSTPVIGTPFWNFQNP